MLRWSRHLPHLGAAEEKCPGPLFCYVEHAPLLARPAEHSWDNDPWLERRRCRDGIKGPVTSRRAVKCSVDCVWRRKWVMPSWTGSRCPSDNKPLRHRWQPFQMGVGWGVTLSQQRCFCVRRADEEMVWSLWWGNEWMKHDWNLKDCVEKWGFYVLRVVPRRPCWLE